MLLTVCYSWHSEDPPARRDVEHPALELYGTCEKIQILEDGFRRSL